MADSTKILKWFETLASRTLDLVGDYAGDELFLIEGDSILLQCFSDDSLDFSYGFQLLHATSLVEKFLAQLHQRKSCIPADALKRLWPRYRLAREMILQHLLQRLAVAVPSIQVRCFDTYRSDDFQEYLHTAGAYFLMCHDGTSPVLDKETEDMDTPDDSDISPTDDDGEELGVDESINNMSSEVWPTKVMLRSMIHWFICHGYNISVLNSLDCRDSKVMSMIFEGSASGARQLYNSKMSTSQISPEYPLLSPQVDNNVPNVGSLNLHREQTVAGNTNAHSSRSMLASEGNDGSEVPGQWLLDNISMVVKKKKIELSQREWAAVVTIGMMSQSSLFGGEDILGACAILLHTAIMRECKLSDRAIPVKLSQVNDPFLDRYVTAMIDVITSGFWQTMMEEMPCNCDLADGIDGRLFLETLRVLHCTHTIPPSAFGTSILERFHALGTILVGLFDISLPSIAIVSSESYVQRAPSPQSVQTGKILKKRDIIGVLPFSNPIIDVHLRPVSVVVNSSSDNEISNRMSRVFQELSHWHNHTRLLNPRSTPPLTDWQKMKINRRNQTFMADVTRYAGSLTNAVGGSLMPESVYVQSRKKSKQTQVSRLTSQPKASNEQLSNNDSTGQKKIVPHRVRDEIAAGMQVRQDKAVNTHLAAWKIVVSSFDNVDGHLTRYIKVKEHLSTLSAERRNSTEAEILAYVVSTLVKAWKEKCDTHRRGSSIQIVALIWHHVQQIAKLKQGVTQEIAECIQATVRALNLPAVDVVYQQMRKLSFEFAHFMVTKGDVGVALSPTEFQLIHAGPYLDRDMGSVPDPRVRDFEPDQWQRDVLDQIDARKSLFVMAPTSAGKTFISFYAIKQVLEDDNDGVLVYVAPTKALVNQISAEIQARFSKSFNNTPGKSVWAIYTRDYRINNPMGCQVLITVPHILQIMLLAPSNAKSWSPRVKRIIFDEIHCIGQAEDGVVWEQLLLLAPCPIIALSATVGNPGKFKEWLNITQKANGLELKMIEHKTRYSDLRKYVYQPPKTFVFNGLSPSPQLPPLGLDESPHMTFVHPVVSLIDRSRGLPDDLTLEPRDCYILWKTMDKYSTAMYPVDESLAPYIALPNLIKKSDVIIWEAQLKTLLRHWMNYKDSPFEAVVQDLSEEISSRSGVNVQVSSGKLDQSIKPEKLQQNSIRATTLPLICSFHDQGALPALFFNYDRSFCERICEHLVRELQESEERWKASDPGWKKKMAKFCEWQRVQAKKVAMKDQNKIKLKRQHGDDEDEDTPPRLSQQEQAQESASRDINAFEIFRPDDPIPGFHLADEKRLTRSEFEEYATELRQRDVPERLITALSRGIGVHHSGLNRKYRQVCEILFRKGYLRVVIATGTVALGINMPCKTVVFSGDSVFLTALGFRQAAGRAGRRGFDFLGNVVFQGISHMKVCRLLSSRLPDLNGHFPITTSLVLRLFILLRESKTALYAIKAINSILSCPRIYLGGPESKHTVLHHLRFSIEYLRRNSLLDKDGAPLNFAWTIAHLYYTENSSFAFHALLSQGYFHRLCKNIRQKPKQTLRILMLVMSHLFGHRYLQPSILESWKLRSKSTSVVILPPLPKETLRIYSAYVTTFIDQHIHEPECMLPLTGVKYGGDKPAKDISTSIEFRSPTQVTSAFAALSVWLEQSVTPHIQVSPGKGQAPLNAYLYDFYKHGNSHALVSENKIRKGDLWFYLNDFSLVLATIITSLENFMKLSPGVDPDMLETMGGGDLLEEELEDKVIRAADAPLKLPIPAARGQPSAPINRSVKVKKTLVAENWDDSSSGDGEDDEEHRTSEAGGDKESQSPKTMTSSDTDADLKDQGLLQVLKAFKMLQEEFNIKFKAIWA
ncbi:hypothetical protein BJX99DRAFT_269117 [Aspergillus californicus]